MVEFIKFLALAFSALLPVINPIGSALVFLGMVGMAPEEVFRALAKRVALTTALFLLTMDLVGAGILKLFGISLPVVQFAGGLVLAAMGWTLLNEREAVGPNQDPPAPADPSLIKFSVALEKKATAQLRRLRRPTLRS